MKNPSTDNRVTPQRIRIFLGAMIVLFVIFAARLFFLQVIMGKSYLALAEANRTQLISLPSSRGVIYDRNGVILARNVPSYNITITPASLPDDPGQVQAIYRTLSDLTSVPITVPSRPPADMLSSRQMVSSEAARKMPTKITGAHVPVDSIPVMIGASSECTRRT